MSVAGKLATIVGAAGTGAWVTLDAWTAAATVALVTVVAAGLLVWVLASAERTTRLRSLITASRGEHRRSAKNQVSTRN